MTAYSIKVLVPPQVEVPRVARWIGLLFPAGQVQPRTSPAPSSYRRQTPTLLRHIGRSILRMFASAPPSAEQALRSALREVAEVRAMADSYRATDPRLATDLCAAADRRERELLEAQAR